MLEDVIIHHRGGHSVTYEDDLVPLSIIAGLKCKTVPAIARVGLAQAYHVRHAVSGNLGKDADDSCG